MMVDVAFPTGPRMPDPRRAAAAFLIGIAVWATSLVPRVAHAEDFAAYGTTLPDGRRFVGYRFLLEACTPDVGACRPLVDLPMTGVSQAECVAGSDAILADARLLRAIPAEIMRRRWTCSPLYAAPEA